MSDQMWWFTARAGGFVAWGLLGASVLWGLALSSKVLNGRRRPSWILDLHRFLGGLGVIFTAVHVGALMADSYIHFGPVEVLVPLTGSWHPGAVAWGIIGMYLLLAVEITSLARKRLSKRVWRMTHMLSFPLFATTSVHALTAGTDRNLPVVRWTAAAVSLGIAGLTLARLREIERRAAKTATPPSSPEPTHTPTALAPTVPA